MCNKSCTSDTECDPSSYCQTPKCLPRKPPGGICVNDDQCKSSVCGLSGTGNCCEVACAPTNGGVCAPAGCSSTGVCEFPGTSTTCGSQTCVSGVLTPVATCNGAGACQPIPAPCPGNFTCATPTTCLTSCSGADSAGDAQCQSGYYCTGTAGKCEPQVTSGNPCTIGLLDECAPGLTCKSLIAGVDPTCQ